MPKDYHKSPSQPFFSVVIPAFNEEKFLPNCLENLKNQDFKEVGFDKDFNIGI